MTTYFAGAPLIKHLVPFSTVTLGFINVQLGYSGRSETCCFVKTDNLLITHGFSVISIAIDH